MQQHQGSIGIFDSGYGGLTILKEIVHLLPQYNYLYLGDNARSPYGTRSYETVYQYTLQAVNWFFKQGCSLVILACNTASAKALRTIQQNDLPKMGGPHHRVLGVIRPTSEIIGSFTQTGNVGLFATSGTVQSQSYVIEIKKFFPHIQVFQEACPMWVPLVENNEFDNAGADYFIQKHVDQLIAQNSHIDTILLGCTHYPLLKDRIQKYVPANTTILAQGTIVAHSLQNYLQRHPEIAHKCTQESTTHYYTTDNPIEFNQKASIFFGNSIISQSVQLT
jgi:glutamate racemase